MIEHNSSCHRCRVSKYKKHVKYIPCKSCPKIYCQPCIEKYPEILPTVIGCLCCLELCCCIVGCNKGDNHKCCANSRRNVKKKELTNNDLLSKLIEYAESELDILEKTPR